MIVDVTKFLALTAAIAAGTALTTACTVTEDADGENTTGGAANGGAHNVVGDGGEDAGGAPNGGSATEGGAATVQGGAVHAGAATAGAATAGAATAGASNAGAATAGAATAGANNAGAATAGAATAGAATAGASNAGASNAGAAGGAAGGGAVEPECYGEDPLFELDCSTAPVTDCDPANEDALNPIYDGCSTAYGASAYYAYRSGIAAAIAQCVAGITDDECSSEAATLAAACRTEAVANACENPLAIEVCGTEPLTDEYGDVGPGLLMSCPELTEEACLEGLQPYNSMTWTVLCMDPAGEFYDPDFTGDCVARFADCLDR